MINRPGNTFPFLFIGLCCLLLASACRQVEVFEKNTPIPHYKWNHSFPATGSFSIQDTASSYNIYVVLRHTDAYQYNNIWLNIGLQSPGDTMYHQKVNLVLGHDGTGWEGSGMNDIWEVRKLIRGNTRFIKKGVYQFNIFQVMRDNPLPHVMSAGLRVIKAN